MHISQHGHSFELEGKDEDVKLLAESKQLENWLARMDARFRIRRIRVQSADARYDGGLLFAKLWADVTDPEGNPIPGSVFLRGDAVAVLVILKADGQRWVVLASQPRFPAADFESIEIPAGMMDDHGDFAGTAARELKEETGLTIEHDQLVLLDEFVPSGGGSDEHIRLYSCEIETTIEHIEELQGKLAGAAHEHERIRLLLVPLDELPKHTRDIKALLAYGCCREWM